MSKKQTKQRPRSLPPIHLSADAAQLEGAFQNAASAVDRFTEGLETPPTAGAEVAEADRRPGRPAGRKSQERPVAMFRPPRCPTCGSTRREPFRDGPVADDRIAIEIDGQLYNREIWRNTRCQDCGQLYRVVEYRFEPSASTEEEAAISHEIS